MPHEIVDAWAQHPTLRHISDPIFESLRRWTKSEAPTEELIELFKYFVADADSSLPMSL